MDKIKLELLRDMEGYIPPLIPVTEDDKSIIISRIPLIANNSEKII